MGSILSSDTLQRFAPISIEAMRSQGNLYAMPLGLAVNALYYNRQLAPAPAQTLDDLRAQSMAGTPITLDTRFEKAFWGVRAFGGQLFAENGAALLDQGGMADWLRWLVESRALYGIQLNSDGEEVRRRFLAGESAYYVAGASELVTLQGALGKKLGVALLPSGPAGPAQPLVRGEGFVLREGVTEAPQNLALEFMRFATDVESQTLLMREAHKIPANANVNISDVNINNGAFFSVFIEQAQTGFLLPNTPAWQPITELGQRAYEDVLDHGLDPAVVVADLTAAVNRANGIVSGEATATPTPAATEAGATATPDEPAGTATPSTGAANEDVEAENRASEDASSSTPRAP
jgi:arabinogalactan oligomer/maltooligosaccharide transport system substrate-binding protein